MPSDLPSPDAEPDPASDPRARLYARAGAALERFFTRRTYECCARCETLWKRAYPDDPQAGWRLTAGRFPGCCQPGLADAPRLPGHPDWTELPDGVTEQMRAERTRLGRPEPVRYMMRDDEGAFREGRACPWLGDAGCKLGQWKPPLCFLYVCPPLLDRIAEASGGLELGDPENFCGAALALRAVAEADLDEARAAVTALEERLTILDQALGEARLCAELGPVTIVTEPEKTP